jgi:iron(III) transport system substrate-binding protein
MKKTRWLLYRWFLLVFVVELVSWREASPQPAGPASLIEGAKKEGRVVWYATLNINDSNVLLSRFEQKYPFVKTELLRAGSEQLLNRILTEDSAGRSALDLVNLTTINALKKRGLLQAHRSSEFSAYPQQFEVADGDWESLFVLFPSSYPSSA